MRERSYSFDSSSRQVESSEDVWTLVSGGFPSKDPTVYSRKTIKGIATLSKKGKKFVLSLTGKEVVLKRATFHDADIALWKILSGSS